MECSLNDQAAPRLLLMASSARFDAIPATGYAVRA